MTRLRKMMLEELERRNYSEATTRCYIRTVEDLSKRLLWQWSRVESREPTYGSANYRQPNWGQGLLPGSRQRRSSVFSKPRDAANCRMLVDSSPVTIA
jgi:hypothetical protein